MRRLILILAIAASLLGCKSVRTIENGAEIRTIYPFWASIPKESPGPPAQPLKGVDFDFEAAGRQVDND